MVLNGKKFVRFFFMFLMLIGVLGGQLATPKPAVAASTVIVKIVDGSGHLNMPLSGASVEVSTSYSTPVEYPTDPFTGQVEIPIRFDGLAQFVAGAPGYFFKSRLVETIPGDTLTLTFALLPMPESCPLGYETQTNSEVHFPENFNSAIFPPTGWSTFVNKDPNPGWGRYEYAPFEAFAYHSSTTPSDIGIYDGMTSPVVNLLGAGTTLTFDVTSNSPSENVLSVMLHSTDGGGSDYNLGYISTTTDWNTVQFPLDDAVGNYEIVFYYEIPYDQADIPSIGVDNVNISITSCVAIDGARISGYVTDENTSAPINNALVGDVTTSGHTNSWGYYEFWAETSPMDVTAEADGYITEQAPVSFENHQVVRQDFALAQPYSGPVTLTVDIVDGSGHPGMALRGSLVVTPSGGSPFTPFVRPDTGQVTITLDTGTVYELSASAPGYITQTRSATYTTETASETFALLPDPDNCPLGYYPYLTGCTPRDGARITGIVLDGSTFEYVPLATITAGSSTTETTAYGQYDVWAESSPVIISASRTGYDSKNATVSFIKDTTVRQDFMLFPAAPVGCSLNIVPQPRGAVTRSPDKLSYLPGELVTITAVPDPGWRFFEWSGSITGTEATKQIAVTCPNAITALFEPEADLAVQISQSLTGVNSIRYTIDAINNGPAAANGAKVDDVFENGLSNISWTCTASNGAVCPHASGTGDIHETIATLPSGGKLRYVVNAYLLNWKGRFNTVTITAPSGVADPVLTNNTASHIVYMVLLPLIHKSPTP